MSQMKQLENYTIIMPEVEFFFIEKQNLILIEIINLEDSTFERVKEITSETKDKRVMFEDNYIVLEFRDKNVQFFIEDKEGHNIQQMMSNGHSLGFSFINKEKVPCENVVTFKSKLDK